MLFKVEVVDVDHFVDDSIDGQTYGGVYAEFGGDVAAMGGDGVDRHTKGICYFFI